MKYTGWYQNDINVQGQLLVNERRRRVGVEHVEVPPVPVRHLGLYPIVTLQYNSVTLYQVSYHTQSLFF
jgi:hypothetical protein